MIGIITNFNLAPWGEDARRAGEGLFFMLKFVCLEFFHYLCASN